MEGGVAGGPTPESSPAAPAAPAMLVIENPNGRLNAGERAFIAHQRGKKGIALVNFLVGGGGPRKPGREVDAIMLLPHGIFCVEVKATTAVGLLDAPQNDAWSVGDIATPFSSKSRSPSAQADQAAKILASHLVSKDWPKGYVTPVVSISGHVTVPDNVMWVGTVGVSTVEHFDLIVKQSKSKRIQARHVGPMLERLGVSKSHIPSMERLLAEGFSDAFEAPEPEPGQKITVTTEVTVESAKNDVEVEVALDVAVETTSHTPDDDDQEDRPDEHEEQAPLPVGIRARVRHWFTEPLGKDRATTVRTGALTSIVVLLGVWQLMSGHIFMGLIGPEVGRHYFIYGTWQPLWDSVADAGAPGLQAFAAPAVGAVLVVLFSIAQWLRLNVGSATRTEILLFWVSIFTLIITSPVLFSTLGWAGVWITWLAYTAVWPFTAIVVKEVRKSALGEHIDRVWKEYEI